MNDVLLLLGVCMCIRLFRTRKAKHTDVKAPHSDGASIDIASESLLFCRWYVYSLWCNSNLIFYVCRVAAAAQHFANCDRQAINISIWKMHAWFSFWPTPPSPSLPTVFITAPRCRWLLTFHILLGQFPVHFYRTQVYNVNKRYVNMVILWEHSSTSSSMDVSIKWEELMKKTTTEKCIYVLCAHKNGKWEMIMATLCLECVGMCEL